MAVAHTGRLYEVHPVALSRPAPFRASNWGTPLGMRALRHISNLQVNPDPIEVPSSPPTTTLYLRAFQWEKLLSAMMSMSAMAMNLRARRTARLMRS